MCRKNGKHTSSKTATKPRVLYDWNLTYAHVFIDRLWPSLENTFHSQASTILEKLKQSYAQTLALLGQEISLACKNQKLPTSCKEIIARLAKSLENTMAVGIKKTITECKQLPAQLLDHVEARVKGKLGTVYRAAPTITHSSGGKYQRNHTL